MEDLFTLRSRMVEEQLEARGISDPAVLDAMRSIPRERFVDPEAAAEAYADRPLPIGYGQTISQPYIVALMAQAASLRAADRALEIGCGSGYGAAVLGRLAGRVWSIERLVPLARRAGSLIAELGLSNVTVLRGDGSQGWAPAAPFDAIVVTAAAAAAPDALRMQLKIGGRLILPIGEPEEQRLVRIVRTAATQFDETDLAAVRFVPLIED